MVVPDEICEPPSLPICPQHNVSVLGTLVVEHWNLTIIRLSSIFMRAALLRSPMPELETSNVQAHMGRYAVWRIEAVDVAVFPSRAMPPAEMRLTDWGRDEAPKITSIIQEIEPSVRHESKSP